MAKETFQPYKSDVALALMLTRDKVRLFPNERAARNLGNGWLTYRSADDLARDYVRVSVDDIFELHNAIVPPKDRWKKTSDISTRVEGVWQLWDAAFKYLPIQKDPDMPKKKVVEEEEVKPTKKGKKAAAAAPVEEKEKRERRPTPVYDGKKLVAKVTLEESGRREGSEAYNALAIIVGAGKKGIRYEDYVTKGGGLKYVTWSLDNDHISIL
ncbi:MAG: hypothetical protein EHM36_05150 [Deltaproteobacteria bacterium]|nr:MAG: hypothetical protein EHM36_05150 [Deltaproteobacteria bacterium]